ncbi:hypothetical protein ACS0TY_034491 [Phlomoides rotata]
MDSTNYSFKETILSQEQPSLFKKPRFKKLKPLIFFTSLFILVILIAAGSIILSSIFKKSPNPDAYLSGSSRYFCHLTPYPDLCYTSMSSIINNTALKSGPGPIFITSLIVAINQLNNTATSITKALSMNNSIFGPRLSTCRKLVHDSLSRLNDSLATFGDDSDIESLSYVEMDELWAWAKASRRSVRVCLLTLEGDEKMVGVEGVKMGVEKANKLIINSVSLFQRREDILFDFYNPFYSFDDYEYGYSYSNNFYFEYRILILLYSGIYLFIALLYFLFWRGH